MGTMAVRVVPEAVVVATTCGCRRDSDGLRQSIGAATALGRQLFRGCLVSLGSQSPRPMPVTGLVYKASA